jgi:hypothetical protein
MKMERIAAEPGVTHWRPASRIDWLVPALVLLITAVVMRIAIYGDPLFGDDEEFYLLVGDRMWHGAMPYLDIFDRKPIGLFLIFAGIRSLGGGDGVLVAQLVATAFAWGTALAVYAIASMRVSRLAALGAGIFYLATLTALAGGGTQAAVFYNLPVAVAAWLVLRTRPALDGSGDLVRASGAMLLCGCAIQIKTNVAIEGAAIGLWLVVRLLRTRSPGDAAARAVLFALLGLLPTVAAGLFFAAHGQFGLWWFANFRSQFLKTGGLGDDSRSRILQFMLSAGPLAVWVTTALVRSHRDGCWSLLIAWSVAALIDAVSIGNFWVHYLQPLAVPTAVLTGELFAWRRVGRPLFLALVLPATVSATVFPARVTSARRDATARTLAALPADVATRCVLAYDVPEAYLHLSHACLVTRYIFVDELRSAAEAKALPDDAGIALRQALDRRPGTILTMLNSHWKLRNKANDAALAAALAAGYRSVAKVPQRIVDGDDEAVVVWRRRDLL